MSVYLVQVQHDDHCKTLKTGNGDMCDCEPDVVIKGIKPERLTQTVTLLISALSVSEESENEKL